MKEEKGLSEHLATMVANSETLGNKPWRGGQIVISKLVDDVKHGLTMPEQESLTDFLPGVWMSGDVAFLYAYTNMGKSILAVQLANEAGRKGHKVVYCDFEMKARPFANRYSDARTGQIIDSPIYRLTRDLHGVDKNSINSDGLLKDIEKGMVFFNADVMVVDNLSFVCADAEKGQVAAEFLHRLQDMSTEHGWSILVIAHTPKRDQVKEWHMSDLAGSQHLGNFCDAAFVIGAVRGSDEVYIKQTKSRNGYTLDENNVKVCRIVKDGPILRFEHIRYDRERNLIADEWQREQAQQRNDFIDQVRELQRQGMPYRTIAERLGVTLSKVQRALDHV